MKHIKEYLFLALFAVSSTASAIIIRDDIADEKYQIPASALPALADFPGEGHGALISPKWVVTAAHVVHMQHIQEIMINGLPRKVESVVVHPGFKMTPATLVKEALASGDGSKLAEFLASSDDIALIKLKAPVTDVKPISLYRGSNEIGRTVQLIGKGATGNGNEGVEPHSPHRTTLRRAFNVISSVYTRWISYTFDSPKSAIPLEGMAGDGDSGSPVLIMEERQWQLAGLVSWDSIQRDLRTYRGVRYGDGGNNVRISHYIAWIESSISSEEQKQNLEPTGG
ncbi:S1 family peptidase [Microbulbifer hainanensis]|uniref:S1 family peptidase n=1 Tax=Microbulbifer hainanensis TaxID=2735675 RepID=UPI001D035E1F|nr:trypsin-like serine protease [Microbulbifer hainanensis]